MDPQEVKELEKAEKPEIVEAAPTVGETLDFGVSDEPTLVGQVLSDRYRITGQVGSGAMGTVYRAEHVLMEGQVHAIKVLHKHLTSDAHSLQRFQVEARAASALRHDRLLTVTDFGLTATNQPFIVMDYIAGESLADVLKRQRTLSIQEFVEVFTQVCEGLAHAHEKNVVHRDLKPSNIILTTNADGTTSARIVDFGIAKILPNHAGAAQHLTQTGEIFGSPLYMSPEQCRGGKIDCRSDIYSLGCVMFEALTGSVPVQEESAIETLFKHINGNIPPISQLYPKLAIPAELDGIVGKCLANYPENRYQEMEDISKDLDQFRLQLKLPVVARSAAPKRKKQITQPSGAPNVNRFLAAMCVVLFLALGSVLAIHLTQSDRPHAQSDAPYTLPDTTETPDTPAIDISIQEQVPQDAEQATKDSDLAWSKLYDEGAESALRPAIRALSIRQKLMPNSDTLAESYNQCAYIEAMLAYNSYGDLIPSKMELAERYYQQAIKMSSNDNPEALDVGKPLYQRNLADLYMDNQQWGKANALLEQVRSGLKQEIEEIDPRDNAGFAFLTQLARANWGLGKYDLASKIQIKLAVPSVKFADLKMDKKPVFAGNWEKVRLPGDYFFYMQLQQLPSGVISGKIVAAEPSKTRNDGDNETAGTVKGDLGNLTWHTEMAAEPGESVLIKMNNYVIWHSAKVPKESYYPDSCVLTRDAGSGSLSLFKQQ